MKSLLLRNWIIALLAFLPLCANADSGLPFTAEENADGARFVWYVLQRSGMEFEYLPADHFPESPNFAVIEHGVQDTGDVAGGRA